MSTLKTALENAINEWEDRKHAQETAKEEPPQTEGKHLFRPSNNISRTAFYAIANANPLKTRKQLTDELVAQGYKEKSAASILTQIIKNKLARKHEDGTVQALVKHYKPLKSTKQLKGASVPEIKRKQVTLIKKPAPVEVVKPVEAAPKVDTGALDVDAWMETVPLKTAREIYWRLHVVFGGSV